MDRTYLARLTRGSSMSPLTALTRNLEELAERRVCGRRLWFRRHLRSRVVRWLIELETTECPDQVWAAFEAWLAKHPERLEMYLAAERTRQVMDELCQGCPREGSQEAERLLRRLAGQARRPRGRATGNWIILSLSVASGAVVGTLWMLV